MYTYCSHHRPIKISYPTNISEIFVKWESNCMLMMFSVVRGLDGYSRTEVLFCNDELQSHCSKINGSTVTNKKSDNETVVQRA